jgi:hypothetical protein
VTKRSSTPLRLAFASDTSPPSAHVADPDCHADPSTVQERSCGHRQPAVGAPGGRTTVPDRGARGRWTRVSGDTNLRSRCAVGIRGRVITQLAEELDRSDPGTGHALGPTWSWPWQRKTRNLCLRTQRSAPHRERPGDHAGEGRSCGWEAIRVEWPRRQRGSRWSARTTASVACPPLLWTFVAHLHVRLLRD